MPNAANPFDELAAMFLTGGDGAVATIPPRSPAAASSQNAGPSQSKTKQPIIELLITGNLPVRGNLWLTPYADKISRQSGTTAMVRLDGPDPGLQLLNASAEITAKSLDAAPFRLFSSLGSDVDAWIVRAPSGLDVSELVAATTGRIDRLTILTSADEAALVAAYQTIKELVEAETPESEERSESTNHLPPLRLAIVGVDSATAASVVERFNRTALSFLGVEVQLGLCLPRMDAGARGMRTISFGNDHPLHLSETLAEIDRARKTPRQTRTAAAVDRTAMNRHHTPPSVLKLDGNGSAQPANHGVKIAPKPSLSIEPKHEVVATQKSSLPSAAADLASHIEGLTLLPMRSPGHERVELAVDGSGRLHLLAQEQFLRELTIVQQWAATHASLLNMACPRHSINVQQKPHCHLFTSTPASLADLHGTDIRLHVLAPVAVNGQTAWYSAPLNCVSE